MFYIIYYTSYKCIYKHKTLFQLYRYRYYFLLQHEMIFEKKCKVMHPEVEMGHQLRPQLASHIATDTALPQQHSIVKNTDF